MFCTKCGSELKEGNLYCEKCGHKVEVEPEVTEIKPEKKPQKSDDGKKADKKKIIIIVAAIVVVIGAIVGFIVYKASMPKDVSMTINEFAKLGEQEKEKYVGDNLSITGYMYRDTTQESVEDEGFYGITEDGAKANENPEMDTWVEFKYEKNLGYDVGTGSKIVVNGKLEKDDANGGEITFVAEDVEILEKKDNFVYEGDVDGLCENMDKYVGKDKRVKIRGFVQASEEAVFASPKSRNMLQIAFEQEAKSAINATYMIPFGDLRAGFYVEAIGYAQVEGTTNEMIVESIKVIKGHTEEERVWNETNIVEVEDAYRDIYPGSVVEAKVYTADEGTGNSYAVIGSGIIIQLENISGIDLEKYKDKPFIVKYKVDKILEAKEIEDPYFSGTVLDVADIKEE